MTSPIATLIGTSMLPKKWTLAHEVLTSHSSESHRLLLYLLDKVHAQSISRADLGLHNESSDEEVNFVAKLESVARFAMLAERYGMPFDLNRQALAFLRNDDLAELAGDLGMTVLRPDLPWALEIIGLDTRLRANFELPPEVLPLDILFVISSRVRDWYEESMGSGFARPARHRVFDSEEVREFAKNTLIHAYDTYLEELEISKDESLAKDVVRNSLGMAG